MMEQNPSAHDEVGPVYEGPGLLYYESRTNIHH